MDSMLLIIEMIIYQTGNCFYDINYSTSAGILLLFLQNSSPLNEFHLILKHPSLISCAPDINNLFPQLTVPLLSGAMAGNPLAEHEHLSYLLSWFCGLLLAILSFAILKSTF